MEQDTMAVDSRSMGDATRHRPLEELEKMLLALPSAPADEGRITFVMRRGPGGQRELLSRVVLRIEDGVPGDAWGRHAARSHNTQITVMQKEVAELIANGQPLMLFGDNLFVELDLSGSNLPPGSCVRAGNAVLEVTPKPHNGCHKFQARFGADALRLISRPDLLHRNFRGIHMRVIEDGEVRTGDRLQVLSRG